MDLTGIGPSFDGGLDWEFDWDFDWGSDGAWSLTDNF